MSWTILPKTWTPHLLGTLRIATAFLFVQHGTAKLFGLPHIPMFEGLRLFSLLGLAGVLEFVGGLLLLVGLFTRPVAFILSGLMAFAYFIAHAREALLPIQNKGELAIMFCFVFLYLASAGPGRFALDRESA